MLTIIEASDPGERPKRRRAAARRLDILKVAAEVFLEHGYKAGALSEVARRLGGSKATLYSYFDSKQALFAAVVRECAASQGRRIFKGFRPSDDLAFDLGQLGRMLLAFVTTEEHLALRRAVIAEAGGADLGKLYSEQWRCRAWQPVTTRIAEAMEQGELRRADPWTAAMHLKGLCQSVSYDLRLEGVIGDLAPEQMARAADDAVEVFLRAYAVRRRRRPGSRTG